MLFQTALAQSLADHGVSTMFGLIGDGNLFVVDEFRKLPGTRYVSVANEATAVVAAYGYAQATDQLGVATVTHGPGLTNTVTALVEAVKARRPMLLIAGDTKESVSHHLQDIPQRAVVVATGAGFHPVRAPRTLAEDLAEAVRRAHLERRPIVLNVPVQFQWKEVDHAPLRPTLEPVQDVLPSEDALDQAAGIIASADRPVVLAGRGAVSARSKAALLRLADRLGAPVATTLNARELFRGEPADLGIFGTLSHSAALDVISSSDCIIAFGAGLNQFTTAEGSLVQKRRVVQVDQDRAAFGVYARPDAAVVGSAATVADAIVNLLDQAEIAPRRFASPAMTAEVTRVRDAAPEDHSGGGYVDIEAAVHRIDQALPVARTFVTDAGRFLTAAWKGVRVAEPLSFVQSTNFGAIGLGMGTALGAAVARPEQPTLLIVGDGGFMLGGLNEFNTAVRHGLDMVVVVLNDGSYGAEHIQFVRRDLDPELSLFAWPDLGPVATALGGQGFTVRSMEELDAALAQLPQRTTPVLIDVILDPNKVNGGGH